MDKFVISHDINFNGARYVGILRLDSEGNPTNRIAAICGMIQGNGKYREANDEVTKMAKKIVKLLNENPD